MSSFKKAFFSSLIILSGLFSVIGIPLAENNLNAHPIAPNDGGGNGDKEVEGNSSSGNNF